MKTTKRRVKCYIASPYTNGDKEENVNLQINIADELISRGYAPYVPLLSHFQHLKYPRPETDWYELDNEFLQCCDILIRIRPLKNGKEITSTGAEKEEKLARELRIPVFTFTNQEEVCKYLDAQPFEL